MLTVVPIDADKMVMRRTAKPFMTAEGCLVQSERRAYVHDGATALAGTVVEHVVLSVPSTLN